ncbi:hypothetical protein LIAUS_05525 [Leptospira interrogans]
MILFIFYSSSHNFQSLTVNPRFVRVYTFRVVEKFVVAINKTALINHFIKQKQNKELIFQQLYLFFMEKSGFYKRIEPLTPNVR